MRKRIGWSAVVLLGMGCALSAQQSGVGPTLPAPPSSESSSSGPLTIGAAVTDKAGHPVPGLQQQDFTLLDNGKPTQILRFDAHQESQGEANPQNDPVQILIVIDDVNAGFAAVSNERIQIDDFLHKDQGHLAAPVSLAFLSETGFDEIAAPSTDGNALSAALDQHQGQLRDIGRSAGFYGGTERLEISLRALMTLASHDASVPGRKLVVWISPGWWLFDNPNVMYTSRQQRSFFDTIVAVSNMLRQSHVVLYSVDPLGMADAGGFRTFLWESFVKPVRSDNNATPGNLSLQVLAVQSGGKALSGSNDIAGEIGQCAEDALAWYSLTFNPEKSEKPNTWHQLQLKVDKRGLIVRTRSGYYAQP